MCVGYLITLSISKLHTIDGEMINEFGVFVGMRGGRGNRSILRKPSSMPLYLP
jgi:hypothetical protein